MTKPIPARGGYQAMLVAATVLCVAPWRSLVGAPIPPANLVTARSQSGQFMVYAGRASGSIPPVLELAKNQGFVQLKPTLVAVSCERIKQILVRELTSTTAWRGTIYVVLHPARAASDPITITSERYVGGWQYCVDLPDVLERPRYVRAIVQVLLAEMANRSAPARAAEIPPWLTEGLSELLLDSSADEIILAPPRSSAHGVSFTATQVTARRASLQEQVHRKLRGRPPLTFDGLSWPTAEQLSGDAAELYAASAQLFVGELLRLPNGRPCLCATLDLLPQYYNWQFAFLGGFRAHFQRPLDVEKWWALCRAQVGARDPAQTWSLDESWQRLDQALHAVVEVRTSPNELPLPTDVALQTVIREWDPTRQIAALQGALRELALLRVHVTRDFTNLVQDYQRTLETYLQERDRSGSILPFVRKANRRRAAATAVQQLDALDARRQAFRPPPKPLATAPQ